MKIVIPTHDQQVENHFGHCKTFTVFTLGDHNQVTEKEILQTGPQCGCKSELANLFNQLGIGVMLAGNLGAGALNKMQSAGISVVRGCQGSVASVLKDYLSGKLTDHDISCKEHHHGHNCQHT
ncbi:MAG: NifB/NifX family molybdenum-iron cluster-binding protein [Candidatus Cyclobacteriaceae bacterium M3_2C_046]